MAELPSLARFLIIAGLFLIAWRSFKPWRKFQMVGAITWRYLHKKG